MLLLVLIAGRAPARGQSLNGESYSYGYGEELPNAVSPETLCTQCGCSVVTTHEPGPTLFTCVNCVEGSNGSTAADIWQLGCPVPTASSMQVAAGGIDGFGNAFVNASVILADRTLHPQTLNAWLAAHANQWRLCPSTYLVCELQPPTPPMPASPGAPDGLSDGAVAGIVVGIIVGTLALIGLAALLLCRGRPEKSGAAAGTDADASTSDVQIHRGA